MKLFKSITTVFTLCLSQQMFGQCIHPIVDENCSFQAIGHRAYSHIYPENSLLSLEEAFKHGIKYCEVDVSLTTDNVYVLFHDAYALHRTTNSQGRIDESTYNDIKDLDVGIYKDQLFAGTRIPTLVEALQIAEKYDAHLYLDTKDFSIPAMKQAIIDAGVSPTRLLPSITTISTAEEFRSALPETPWIWYNGGLFPDDISDVDFYNDCVSLGCLAFEVSFLLVDTTAEWSAFEQNVHQAGAKVWAFTVNDPIQAQALVNLGVDGLESDRPSGLTRTICEGRNTQFPDSLTTGNWRFKSSLQDVKGVGSQFRTLNYENPSPDQVPTFGTCSSFGIPGIASDLDSVMLIPAQSSEDGILVYTNFSVDDDGAEDFTYTFMMDFLVPETSEDKWISIYQTSTSNGNDAELFINPDGEIGIIGDYFGDIESDTWYRLIVAYDGKNQLLHLYLDGEKIGSIETYTNRWAVFNSAPPGETQGFLLFSDDDNETADIYVSSFQVRDYALSDTEAMQLGNVAEIGFPSHNADLLLVNSPLFYTDSVFLDYDLQQYTCVIQPQHNLNNVPINFSLVSGASASQSSGSFFDFSNSTNTITVTSGDNTVNKEWEICVRRAIGVGVSEIKNNEFVLYPNPARNLVTIEGITAQHKWKIRNYTGTIVASGNHSNIDISAFSSGLYTLTIIDPESAVMQHLKFIKQ